MAAILNPTPAAGLTTTSMVMRSLALTLLLPGALFPGRKGSVARSDISSRADNFILSTARRHRAWSATRGSARGEPAPAEAPALSALRNEEQNVAERRVRASTSSSLDGGGNDD